MKFQHQNYERRSIVALADFLSGGRARARTFASGAPSGARNERRSLILCYMVIVDLAV